MSDTNDNQSPHANRSYSRAEIVEAFNAAWDFADPSRGATWGSSGDSSFRARSATAFAHLVGWFQLKSGDTQ